MFRNETKNVVSELKIVNEEIAKASPRIYDIVITDTHRKDTNDKTNLDFITCLNAEGKYYLARMTIVHKMDVFGVEVEFELNCDYPGFEQYVKDDFYSNNSIIRNHLIKYIKLIKEFRYEPRYVVTQKDKDTIWNVAGYDEEFDACHPKYLNELKVLFDRYKKFKHKNWNTVVDGIKNIISFHSTLNNESTAYKIKKYNENRDNMNIPKVEDNDDEDS